MAPNSQVNTPQEVKVLEAQIRQCFANVVWTHKTQEKCADILLRRDSYIKTWMIFLSALTTTSLLLALFGDSRWGTIIGAGLSTILLYLTTYSKENNFAEVAQKHIDAATQLWNIRETYLSLLTDIEIGKLSIDEIITKRDDLQNQVALIYKGAPRTNSKAYNQASKALKLKEEFTYTNAEIDAYLPNELKKERENTLKS